MNLSKFILTKKVVFIVVGLILLAELLWAGWTINKNNSSGKLSVDKTPAVVSGDSTISLKTPNSSFKVEETILVTIEMNSSKVTDGADVVISYDAIRLSILPGLANAPVKTGTLYSEYPVNQVDQAAGKIIVSGIAPTSGVVPKGLFGTVTFKALKAGSAKISIDFTPGSTTDSNIIETKTAKDILNGVNNLGVNIQ